MPYHVTHSGSKIVLVDVFNEVNPEAVCKVYNCRRPE